MGLPPGPPAAHGSAGHVLDAVAARLRAGGSHMTGPRRAVVLALAATEELQTSEEVVASVALIDPDVHRASVYRALEALVATDLVVHVHLGHGATAYHLADPAGRRHLHVQCTSCGAVADVVGTLLDGVARRLRREHGFMLDAAHVALSGTCADCASRGADVPEPAEHDG